MSAAGIDIIEIGLRSLNNNGFKGACAYSTDEFISGLTIPSNLIIGVMLNASELIGEIPLTEVLERLFHNSAEKSPVKLVRIACHVHEFAKVLPAIDWFKKKGYTVGFNLMQMADRSEQEIKSLAKLANEYPIDVLYFADSLGSMGPQQTALIVQWLREEYSGDLGIHTHDNMGLALSNTLKAAECGVSWLDATVTGMGRGPGNARTEELAIELAEQRNQAINMIPLMNMIRQHFKPLQQKCGWGTNPYYYLAGKYGIHPTYIQQMLGDSRFSEEDILSVIDHLRREGGKNLSINTLTAARHFYLGEAKGSWQPKNEFAGRDVLLLGTGPGVAEHRPAIERYIQLHKPLVLAFNTQQAIAAELIDYGIACHPVRLLADCEAHAKLPQPLITPYSMLPAGVQQALEAKEVRDFGLNVQENSFDFADTSCTLPTSLVMAYAFAVCASGNAARILLAGFDGYKGVDSRNDEMNKVVKQYRANPSSTPLFAITPTLYDVNKLSIYGFMR